MESDSGWLWLVKKVGVDCFMYIGAQLLPTIALRKYVVAETFCYKPAIRSLSYAEDDFH